MNTRVLLLFLLQFIFVYCSSKKRPKKFNQTNPSPRFDNPNFVKDRFKTELFKPGAIPPSSKYHIKEYAFHPSYMDYCDPYHCNDYHSIACGVNRKNFKFKWFQSPCHIILHNKCSAYRGTIKYDWTYTEFCIKLIMYRGGCPRECETNTAPVCARSTVDNHVVLFQNICFMEMANCMEETLQEYDEIETKNCLHLLEEQFQIK